MTFPRQNFASTHRCLHLSHFGLSQTFFHAILRADGRTSAPLRNKKPFARTFRLTESNVTTLPSTIVGAGVPGGQQKCLSLVLKKKNPRGGCCRGSCCANPNRRLCRRSARH